MGKLWKTAVMGDRRILCLMKKMPLNRCQGQVYPAGGRTVCVKVSVSNQPNTWPENNHNSKKVGTLCKIYVKPECNDFPHLHFLSQLNIKKHIKRLNWAETVSPVFIDFVTGWHLKCYSKLSAQLDVASQWRQWPKANHEKAKQFCSVNHLKPIKLVFHMLKAKLKEKH